MSNCESMLGYEPQFRIGEFGSLYLRFIEPLVQFASSLLEIVTIP